jgi:hypothetical protein
MSNLANIAIGPIVVGLLLVCQLQPRPAREASSIRPRCPGRAVRGHHRVDVQNPLQRRVDAQLAGARHPGGGRGERGDPGAWSAQTRPRKKTMQVASPAC